MAGVVLSASCAALIDCAVMVGANSGFAAMLLFPSNDLFNVERKGGFFNPFCSLLVCAFFISGWQEPAKHKGRGYPEGTTIVRKPAGALCPTAGLRVFRTGSGRHSELLVFAKGNVKALFCECQN